MKKSVFFVLMLSLTYLSVLGNPIVLPVERDPKTARPSRPRTENSDFGKRVTLGILFGSGMDWLTPKVDSMQNGGMVANLKYGIPLDINFTTKNNYYFSTGLFINHSGGRLAFNTYIMDSLRAMSTERNFRAIYVTIPTGIKLKTPSMSNFVVAANFGLYHSFRLNANYFDKYENEIGEVVKSSKHVYADGTAFFKESAYIGLGLEYIIKADFRVYFYVDYTYGFLNFFNPNNSGNLVNGSKDKAMPSSVEFQVGITF